ncbi:hypothetical protein AVEN_89497-1 [Araneus ventricosus]|uniref:Mitochondrial inner membrane protease subunit 2 n=1 Tax=Araneus ventricosus TaxID=182803 RepID=A0A4Y2TKU9_ARAVE|nr:hypothetical protein AVEN_89497-1 [Araneus ventricosus]
MARSKELRLKRRELLSALHDYKRGSYIDAASFYSTEVEAREIVRLLRVQLNTKAMSGGRWGLWLRRLGKNFLYSVPVTVAFLDSVGYVAKVEGISMQPSLNPEDQKTNDYVLLNKWAIRNFKVQHGDIVALT